MQVLKGVEGINYWLFGYPFTTPVSRETIMGFEPIAV